MSGQQSDRQADDSAGGADTSPATRWVLERTVAQRQAYTRRFDNLAATGQDVDGEGRFVDAIADRGATILDAGCGTGRLAAYLRDRGHRAVGVDADELLVDAGKRGRPDLPLVAMDLLAMTPESLAAAGLPARYDLVVAAGNVMVYLAPGTESEVVSRLAAVLRPGGRVAFGFATDRAFTHADLDRIAAGAGWIFEHRFGTWQCAPAGSGSGWAVSVFHSEPDARDE
ncbi:MAG: class I SAM-dependent methyltransferase [Nocardioides sp.]